MPQTEGEPVPQAEPDEVGKEGSTPLKSAPVEEPSEEEKGLEEMGSEVDRIREIALRGMVKLCHNTEDPAYDALKKIFQFCDKANEKKEEPEFPRTGIESNNIVEIITMVSLVALGTTIVLKKKFM